MTTVPRTPRAGVRKPPREEIAGRDTCCGALYGKIDARKFKFGTSWMSAAGLECMRNFDVMARMLLNGDLSFLALCDFNELRVAKIARSATPA